MTAQAPRPRILHVHAAFDSGPGARRCARLIDAFADADHAVVSGDPARRSAAAAIDGRRAVSWPKFPPLSGKPWPGRLKRLARAMAGYDLVCTYGWGAIDAALAHTLFADVWRLAPLVHHEDDTGGRDFYRRIALGRSAALVVSTPALERVALARWQQPRTRVRRIPDGIDTRAYAVRPKRDALPSVVKRKGELWLGTNVSGADPAALVGALADLPEEWQLVATGADPAGAALIAEAERRGLEHRVHLPGAVDDPARVFGLFDVFVGAGPPGVVEAMAAGKPVLAPRESAAADIVASENGPFLYAAGEAGGMAKALARLALDPALRERVGEGNRARARAEFDEAVMLERYRALYRSLMGRR